MTLPNDFGKLNRCTAISHNYAGLCRCRRQGAEAMNRAIARSLFATVLVFGLSACTNPYDPVQRAVGGGLLGGGSGAAIGAAAGGGPGAALGAAIGGAVGVLGGAATTPPPPGYYGYPGGYYGYPGYPYGSPSYAYGYPSPNYGYPGYSYGYPSYSYGYPGYYR
jgi:hypothetical protein